MEALFPILAAGLYGIVSGFNDGGNLLGLFTSGRVISPRLGMLLLLAAATGPLVGGTAVAHTVGAGIIDLRGQGSVGFCLITVASIIVVLLSWLLGLPTSTTLALVGAMLGWVASGMVQAHVDWTAVARVLIGIPVSVMAGGVLALLLYWLLRTVLGNVAHTTILSFARLQVVTAALQAFAYGLNDMEKSVGLIAIARSFAGPDHAVDFSAIGPVGGAFLTFAFGTLLGGSRIARRVGFGVFRARPAQALSSQMGAGLVVIGLAVIGAPVSTTQTIGGAQVGVGVVERASAVRWGFVREMLAGWMVTLPLAFVIGAGLHILARAVSN